MLRRGLVSFLVSVAKKPPWQLSTQEIDGDFLKWNVAWIFSVCSHVKFHRSPLVTISLYEELSASSQPDQTDVRQSPLIRRLLVLDLDKNLVRASSTPLLILVGLDRILKPALSHDIVR